MFESDDWTFEDAFDIDEKTIQSHSRCQNDENASSVKRRKLDNCKVFFSSDNTLDSNVNVATKENNSSHKNKSNISRDLLVEIFQENTSQEIFNLAKEISDPLNDVQEEIQCFPLCKTNISYEKSKEKNRIKSVNKVKLGKEVKLIRIFPGPAGLVPDVKTDNIPIVSYLNRVRELEDKIAVKHIEIKSQDEKNLFGEKAWKFLLDDVSDKFLEECRISVIKKKANANQCDNTKVKFLAGVLDYIDHSHDDPFIVLKDSTDNIEGTIHRDIVLKYPVSQVNLLAIYSDKGRIASTSRMENILSNFELNTDCSMSVSKRYVSGLQGMYENCDNIPSQDNFSVNIKSIKEDCKSALINDPISHQSNRKYKNCKQTLKQDIENRKDEIFENPNYSINTSNNLDTNNIFLTNDCEFTTLEEQNCLNSENILFNNKIQCELQARNTNYLENTRKESVINSQNQIRENHLSQSLQKCVEDIEIFNSHYSRESCLSSYDGIAHEVHKNSNLNINSTLPEIKHNSDNSKTLVNYFTDANEYDSDDEILSQLDVDNVFSDSKKKMLKRVSM
ncbi:hypothetical protein CAJAP_01987 [Camponotus japonicus]